MNSTENNIDQSTCTDRCMNENGASSELSFPELDQVGAEVLLLRAVLLPRPFVVRCKQRRDPPRRKQLRGRARGQRIQSLHVGTEY